jgi:hypothetical protein
MRMQEDLNVEIAGADRREGRPRRACRTPEVKLEEIVES